MTTDALQPISVDAERALIGGLLITTEAWPPEAERVVPSDFNCPIRSRVWEAIVNLRYDDEPVDQLTVFGRIKDQEQNKPPGGWYAYLADLTNSTPTAANVAHYAKIIAGEARRRDYLDVMTQAVEDASVPGADADAIATKATLTMGRIAEGIEATRPVMMREAVKTELTQLDERRKTGETVGHQTGYPSLDRITCGLVPGQLTVIAGRPSMGKSSLARGMLIRLAATELSSMLFSFEMGQQEIAQASIAHESHVNLQRIRSATLTDQQYAKVVKGMAGLHHRKIAIVDRPGMPIADIRRTARAYASRHPLHAIVVDYMQLAVGVGHSREEEVASISRGLKALGKELGVAMIAVSQLNRAVEGRKDDKRPRLSDLRESGAIEQDADVVLLLYRDEYYNTDTDQKDVAEVGVAKNRNGPTGMVRLKWFGEYTRFESFED